NNIDLIILDKHLPGLSGADVVNELRTRDRDIPVILISGSLGEASWVIEAKDFVHKPLNLEELLRKINEILSEY
ncbi:MAG: response regulator, partial [Candidatus Omnitrophica bacterium]|nr:response regulator [Candidatus Omnitrophota bacterium]